jgi:DNA-directed DNA polymerase III PolC
LINPIGVAFMFVHLHNHSHFSFKDATPSPADLVTAAKQYEMPAVAITDHTTLAGAVRFYRAAKDAGINPIIGTELCLTSGHHITLLAENLDGYSNLCRLISRLHLSHPGNHEPEATWEDLSPYTSHVLALSGCANSRLAADISTGRQTAAREFIEDLVALYGLEQVYVEMENPCLHDSPRLLAGLADLAKQTGLPAVATNNVHFMTREGARARDMLVCMGQNITLAQPHPRRHPNAERRFKSPREMEALFGNYPEALANTLQVAARCRVELPLGTPKFPHYPLEPGTTSASTLRTLAEDGARWRYGDIPTAVQSQIDHELKVINALGFPEYFLVVHDIVAHARREGILVSGRGSAAGSLVAYVLGITSVDPLQHNLLFERFLNPERRGMPDIDLDFSSARRDEILQYVYDRYGADHVAMVGTVNTISARSALREIGKAMAIPEDEISRLAQFMPHVSARDMTTAAERLPELRNIFPEAEPWNTLLTLSAELDNTPRHLSVHLGGMVISRSPITDLVPLQWSAKGIIIAQYDKDDIEALGLVKMDLLGLRMLAAVQDAFDQIRRDGTPIALETIPPDDPETYALLRSTDTVGLFQLESPGMRDVLGRLQPTNFSDIIANLSLMRPGPIKADIVTPYIHRRHGQEPIVYKHPALAPILGETYGTIIYQEQVLRVASTLAGFTLGQADLLRRAMTHDRSPEEMAGIHDMFMEGTRKQGIDPESGEAIFRELAAFAAYGFNKAHAATFGILAYATAYLKAHYPAYFLAGVLNNEPMGFYPPHVIVNEAKRFGARVAPPSVNRSNIAFTVADSGKTIYTGLKAVVGLTAAQMDAVLRARNDRPFSSLTDFLWRVPLPEAAAYNLVATGGADEFGPRNLMLAELNRFYVRQAVRPNGQLTLAVDTEKMPDNQLPPPPFIIKQRVLTEHKVLGFIPEIHPLVLFKEELRRARVMQATDIRKQAHGTTVRTAGVVVARQMPPTRSGVRVIFLTLEDETGVIDVTVFPKVQERGQNARIALGTVFLMVEGRVRRMGTADVSVVVEKLIDLTTMKRDIPASAMPAWEPRSFDT